MTVDKNDQGNKFYVKRSKVKVTENRRKCKKHFSRIGLTSSKVDRTKTKTNCPSNRLHFTSRNASFWFLADRTNGRAHSSRIRFLRFLQNSKNATFYVFLEWHVKKNVKNVEAFSQVFTFLHFEIVYGHFRCKIVTHMSCYTYTIILKLFILVKI